MGSRYSLAGRTALITGASSGIGAHLARLFADAGANVVLGARRIDRVTALAEELGDRALAVPLDVTVEASIIAGYDAAEARFGTVDTIVANAGTSGSGRSVDLPAGEVRQVIETNFTGVYLTVREGARRLIAGGSREHRRGRAVLVGSITAHMAGLGDSAYAASKAAVAHLGRNFAREWVRHGINVNVIQPGYIGTEISGDYYESAAGQAFVASQYRQRLLDISALDDLTLYLASDTSAQVTGAVIDIDDGHSL